jgi:hypothetical protein
MDKQHILSLKESFVTKERKESFRAAIANTIEEVSESDLHLISELNDTALQKYYIVSCYYHDGGGVIGGWDSVFLTNMTMVVSKELAHLLNRIRFERKMRDYFSALGYNRSHR